MPTVSVIVPIYNSEKYLERCLESIIKQSYSDIEIILVNDGSTDNSGAICQYYGSLDSRITIINQENQGVSAARNCGMSFTRGKYILFCDSDDKIADKYIECLVNQIEECDSDMCICPIVRVYDNKYYVELLEQFDIDLNCSDLANQQNLYDLARLYLIYGPCNKIFKTSLIKKHNVLFPTDTSYGEDLIFVFSYLEHCSKVSYRPFSFYLYYSNSGSLLYKYRPDRFDNSLRINNCVKSFFEKKKLISEAMMTEWSNRILSDAIASISDLYDKCCELSAHEKFQQIKRITLDENVELALQYADTNMFNKQYVCFFKNKLYRMIYLRKVLGQIMRSIKGNK